MAYAQREGPYGGRRLSVPKPDFIPGGMTARSVGDRIRSQIGPRTDADGKRERDELTYQYFQTMLGSAAPKTTDDIRSLAELAREMAGGAVTAPTKPAAPPEPKYTTRPGGQTVLTTRSRREQGLTVRPGGIVMPTTRAVRAGATPGQIGEPIGDWGKKEIARRAATVAATRARADEVARMKKEGTWTPGVIRHEGMVIPEEMFEKAMRERRLPLARPPVSAQAGEDLNTIRARRAEIQASLRELATPGVGIQEGPTQEQEKLRAEDLELEQKERVAKSVAQQPSQRMTETPTMQAFDYTTQTLPDIRGAEEVDAEIKAAREEYQAITSGAAWDEARRAYRESTDLRSQQAAQRRLRELTGPEAKERARERLVALARKKRDLEDRIARGPQAPSATALGTEQVELQTRVGLRQPASEAQRGRLMEAARAGAAGKAAEIAAAQAAAEAPTPYPFKPEKVPAKRQPSLDEARRQDVWGRNKGTPFKEWSEEDRVGFGLVAVERNPVKERALQRVIDSLLTPPYQGEEKPAYRQRVEQAARALKALDENLYDKIVGAGIAAVGEGEEEADRDIVDRVLGFIGLQRASVAPAPPTVEPTPAPEEQTEGAAGAVPQEETMQPASYEEVEAALDEAGGDREAAEAILNRKGLTAEVEE